MKQRTQCGFIPTVLNHLCLTGSIGDASRERGGRKCDEWVILEKDRRQNVIRSLPEVILLERKSLASEPPTTRTTEGTLSERRKRKSSAKDTFSYRAKIQPDERTGDLLQQKACQTEFGVVQKLEEGGRRSEAERQLKALGLLCFCSVRHEAEEGGEAVQGGVEELSTGLPASATICLYI